MCLKNVPDCWLFSTLPWKRWRSGTGRGDSAPQDEPQTGIPGIPLTDRPATLEALDAAGTRQVTCLNRRGLQPFCSRSGSNRKPSRFTHDVI